MKIYIKALGCRLNEAELEQWSASFMLKGHSMTAEPDEADVIIVNTCAVTSDAERKSRQLFNRLYRQRPESYLVVTGCYSSLKGDELAHTLGVDLVISNAQKDQLPELVLEKFSSQSMPLIAMDPNESALFQRGRQRAFIKIQDGCRYRCTYCIVTIARGEERSRLVGDIIDEINCLVGQGVQEVVLTGVHVGGYGADINSTLKTLVVAILRDTDIPRVRFASVEPWDLPEDFFELFANPRLMPHMHLPIQSGVDSVLRRMSRRSKTADFAELIRSAREQVPHFNVTSDIIVGFPGETEQEWQATLDYVAEIGFGQLHVFSYSPRANTKAASLPNPVSSQIKKERSLAMRHLGLEMKREFYQRYAGTQSSVLWESGKKNKEGQLVFHGYTPNYIKVRTTVLDQNLKNLIKSTDLVSYDEQYQVVNAIISDTSL
ncbi:MAG: tRNA (N(6)-L-threonylcarbamoyladenosine(37)-C(2))-methylthiotransferase MtaB [Thiotrichaceae bacterium]|nr:tRNA (N(6)-L-threonylcarbamoyladenosine(37)-C(2))-methylthiotransferase MtaB [Thiotrichaceae bacterium]